MKTFEQIRAIKVTTAYEKLALETYTSYIRRARRHQGGRLGHRIGIVLARE